MKPLHRSTWRTESDCGVQVDVAEGRTTEWAPFREIVVTTDAGMSPAEARRLIADLQHAIALAEEFDAPEREDVSTEDQPKPRKFPIGSLEPDTEVTRVRNAIGTEFVRNQGFAGGWMRVEGRTTRADYLYSWDRINGYHEDGHDVSEVLADSEQVTRG